MSRDDPETQTLLNHLDANEHPRETPASMAPAGGRRDAHVGLSSFSPRLLTKYFTKTLALSCGLVAISTFNYAFGKEKVLNARLRDTRALC